jgi:hypothetical protein
MCLGVPQWTNGSSDVGEHRLMLAAMAEIRRHRLDKSALIVLQRVDRSLKTIDPNRSGNHALVQIGTMLCIEQFLHFFFACFLRHDDDLPFATYAGYFGYSSAIKSTGKFEE